MTFVPAQPIIRLPSRSNRGRRRMDWADYLRGQVSATCRNGRRPIRKARASRFAPCSHPERYRSGGRSATPNMTRGAPPVCYRPVPCSYGLGLYNYERSIPSSAAALSGAGG